MGTGAKPRQERELHWASAAKKELLAFPEDVVRDAGYALHLAQRGLKHPDAKPLKGFDGASVLEVVLDDAGDTYRAVYTVQFKDVVVVLHAFQKKSKTGIKTPKPNLDVIRERLKFAKKHFGDQK